MTSVSDSDIVRWRPEITGSRVVLACSVDGESFLWCGLEGEREENLRTSFLGSLNSKELRQEMREFE